MFKKGIAKVVTAAIVVALFSTVIGAPAMAAHHPSWNQSYGKDSRVVDHQKTAMWMSQMMPGAGEWYNRDFEGGFPWAECILGYICCFIRISSIVDAADGVDNDQFRFNFWASPNSSYSGK